MRPLTAHISSIYNQLDSGRIKQEKLASSQGSEIQDNRIWLRAEDADNGVRSSSFRERLIRYQLLCVAQANRYRSFHRRFTGRESWTCEPFKTGILRDPAPAHPISVALEYVIT
jgi:hypothetical protein